MAEHNDEYERCRYSITCQADDLAVVHSLRALCQFAERGLDHPRIAWGGSGQTEWRDNQNRIVLRFTDPEFREAFVRTAQEVLRPELWREIRELRRDDDPARRQRTAH